MRRHSPFRPIRHQSPLRKRGRVRSLSPLSRSQPIPPGEDHHGRKLDSWDFQSNKSRRIRSRSRSREWNRTREPIDRQPPYMPIMDNGRNRGRELSRFKAPKEKNLEKSKDRNREHERSSHLPRDIMVKEEKLRQDRKRSPNRIRGSLDDFEESYLDNQGFHFESNSGMQRNHDTLILDPSAISFNTFVPEPTLDKPRDHYQSSRNIHDQPRDMRKTLSRGNHREISHEKDESAADRINRLEKLVEKLVENNTGPAKSVISNPSSKDIIPELIPSNMKFSTSQWLNAIHEECLNRNFDEKTSISFMQDKMTGIMKAWFKTVSNYDFTWHELKMLITKTFPDNTDFAETLKLLVTRDKTADETITQYYFSKLYLCEACKITGEHAVSCLIDGLSNPFMKQEVKRCNFLTPEALYSEYLLKFQENEVPIHVDHREVREIIPEFSQDEFIPLEIERNQGHQMNKQSYKGHFQDNRKKAKPLERMKCFTCKKFGHATVDCRHAPICYRCKKKGHIAAKCSYSKVLLISTFNSSTYLAKSRCNVNGRTHECIIDTGCDAVVLKEHVAKDLKLKLSFTLAVLKGYGGQTVIPLGEAKVQLIVGSSERLVTALVVEDAAQDMPVIVGQEFLSQEGVVLCQENGQITIFNSK